MVEHLPSKLMTRVRFPSLAPLLTLDTGRPTLSGDLPDSVLVHRGKSRRDQPLPWYLNVPRAQQKAREGYPKARTAGRCADKQESQLVTAGVLAVVCPPSAMKSPWNRDMSPSIDVFPTTGVMPLVEQTRARVEELLQDLLDSYPTRSTIEVKTFTNAKGDDDPHPVDVSTRWEPELGVGCAYYLDGEWVAST